MKVLERVVDKRLRHIVDIDGMQFGFTKGKGTTYAIWIVRQIQEKMFERNNNPCIMCLCGRGESICQSAPRSDMLLPMEERCPGTNCEIS